MGFQQRFETTICEPMLFCAQLRAAFCCVLPRWKFSMRVVHGVSKKKKSGGKIEAIKKERGKKTSVEHIIHGVWTGRVVCPLPEILFFLICTKVKRAISIKGSKTPGSISTRTAYLPLTVLPKVQHRPETLRGVLQLFEFQNLWELA